MAMEAFDLAERFQVMVFVMSDLDLGMNTWMSQPFTYPEQPLDRGKRLDEPTLARIGEWGRYKDVDGDGIPYRTRPRRGDAAPYFTRGSGHNEKAASTASGRTTTCTTWSGWRASSRRRARYVPKPVVEDVRRRHRHHRVRHEPLGDRREPRSAAREAGIKSGYLRLRAYPFTDGADDVHRPLRAHLRRRAESRRADAGADALDLAPSSTPSCAACCTTAGCRSTRDR